MMQIESLNDYEIDYSLFDKYSLDTLKQNNIFLVKEELLYTIVASSQEQNIKQIQELLKHPIKLIYVEKNELNFQWENLELYKYLHNLSKESINSSNIEVGSSYVINFLDKLFDFAIENHVSDIHIESLQSSVVIRCRIDGLLHQFFRYDVSFYKVLSSVIKLLANLDISQFRKPLDARITRQIQNKEYEFRVSTLPTIYGESIVLRVLDNQNAQKPLEKIGFEASQLKLIKKALNQNQGLILVTGPTGSGKTTTLYSMLEYLNTKEKKIITVEDPVEYKLDGIMQVNVNQDMELDYHTVLKNILRQDPDILMIGEIRDAKALQIALRASLTGHLVISTLHTSNAIESITRLLDLEAQAYLIASTLKLVVSQRLLRTLCTSCKQSTQKGCKECNYSGYKSRSVVSEVLSIDDDISKQIQKGIDIQDIEVLAKDKGFESLEQNALKLLDNGVTSKEELLSKVSYEI